MLSKDGLSSKFVDREIQLAIRNLKSPRIVCLAVDDCRVPAKLEEYPVLRVKDSTDLGPLRPLLQLGKSPQKHRINLSRILMEVVREAKRSRSKRTKLYQDVEDGIWVEGDEAMLREVFQELAHNAFVHGDLDRPISISLNARGRHCLASFENDVSAPSSIDFDEIFRAGVTTKWSGTGLGLYMAKLLIERNGGAIHANPMKLEKGMRFRIEVKLLIASQSRTEEEQSTPEQTRVFTDNTDRQLSAPSLSEIFYHLPTSVLRNALLTSIGPEPSDDRTAPSPDRLVQQFNVPVDLLWKHRIVISKQEAAAFVNSVDHIATINSLLRLLTAANYRQMLKREPSKSGNNLLFTYAEVSCITGFDIHSSLPEFIRSEAASFGGEPGDSSARDQVSVEVIPDDAVLLRRIHPRHILEVRDENGAVSYRPSSAAFDDGHDGTPMSVEALSMLGDIRDALKGRRRHSLVSIQASEFRELGLTLSYSPTREVPARVFVEGKKTRAIKSRLASTAHMVVLRKEPYEFVMTDQLVGREREVQEVMKTIERRAVILVSGDRGIGKTFFARHVYHLLSSEFVKSRFNVAGPFQCLWHSCTAECVNLTFRTSGVEYL